MNMAEIGAKFHQATLSSATMGWGMHIGSSAAAGAGIGAVVGGIAGGLVGEKLSAKAYKCIESKIEEVQHMKKNIEMSEIFTSTKSTKCKVSDERFE